ncbi:MAG: hypothetical protein CMB42_00200 [Euryarchaeota archaeon]|nr:hypothetical protein [Euryarchaeota archaeon]
MQRRRKPKAAPANVFAGGQKPKKPKKTTPQQTPQKSPVRKPLPIPKKTPEIPTQPIVEDPKTTNIDSIPESEVIEVVESQILGEPRRKSPGLKKEVEAEPPAQEEDISTIDLEVREALNRAKKRSEEAKLIPKAKMVTTRPPPKKKKGSNRGKTKTYQPAARERRLNRARHMEYKYEMKGLLSEIGVPEEHRSSLIGSVWAKGERKTAAHAKDFVDSKVTEGILNEDQASSLLKLIDDYTVRR